MTARRALWVLGTLSLLAAGRAAAQATTVVRTDVTQERAAGRQVVGYGVSSRDASLTFHLADGSTVRLALRAGDVLVDGQKVGSYARGGPLATAWEGLLARAAELSTDQMLVAFKDLAPVGAAEADLAAVRALKEPLRDAAPADASVRVPPVAGTPPVAAVPGGVERARAAAEEAAVEAEAIRDGIRVNAREVARRAMREDGAPAFGDPGTSVPEGLLALLGTFVALCGLGFGLSYFGERQLDIVADTASASIARSFFVGLFAQPLVLPAFGMLMAGLILTVVGIIVVPFAILGFVAALAAALIGGYLAVARAVGEGFAAKRRLAVADGAFGTLTKTTIGLGILLSVWLPAVIFGWVPVAGTILTLTAGLATWAAVTTGFGAAILTRGGLRGTFGRKFRPQVPGALAWPPSPLEPEPSPERFDTGEWLGRKAER